MLKSFASSKPVLASVGSLAVILVLLGLWKIPQWQVAPIHQQIDALKKQKPADPKDIATLEKSRIDAENAARTVLVQGVGGLLVFSTVFISWRTLKATQEKQVAERFSKAVEQLGSENNIHARLGGIYALEQIAKDAKEKYYWQVMETLTSYVREKSPYPPKAPGQTNLDLLTSSETSEEIPPLPTDIQAVMTVLARRKHHYGHSLESHPLDLRKVDLRNLELPVNTNLQNAFLGKANLQGAHLTEANLQNAYLGETNLQEAFLRKANLQEAFLGKANLQGAYLTEANLQEGCLGGANLQGARLMKANLQNAHLEEANLQGASFWQINLEGAEFKVTNPEMVEHFGKCEAIGLTWEQINQATAYTKELLPDYLLQQIPELATEAAEPDNLATTAPVSPQHEAEVEQKGESAAS
ncbi:MAG: hypothetical protein DCF22_16550 [Leptolyngbya sp.]|nr:MAG: hypothetical protein DCF22_16550 [Leptolyngbya sp.]